MATTCFHRTSAGSGHGRSCFGSQRRHRVGEGPAACFPAGARWRAPGGGWAAHSSAFFTPSSAFFSSPFWCISCRMSLPPTNSPLMNTCGQAGVRGQAGVHDGWRGRPVCGLGRRVGVDGLEWRCGNQPCTCPWLHVAPLATAPRVLLLSDKAGIWQPQAAVLRHVMPCGWAHGGGRLGAHLGDGGPGRELFDALPDGRVCQHVARPILHACRQHRVRQYQMQWHQDRIEWAGGSLKTCDKPPVTDRHPTLAGALVDASQHCDSQASSGSSPYKFRMAHAMLLKPHMGACGTPCTPRQQQQRTNMSTVATACGGPCLVTHCQTPLQPFH